MTQATRTLAIGAIAVVVAALLPLVLSNYQVGLATEVLIFAILAMSIDILAGFAGRTSLGHGAIFGVSTYVVIYMVSQGVIACVRARAGRSSLRRWWRLFSRCSRSGPPASISCC